MRDVTSLLDVLAEEKSQKVSVAGDDTIQVQGDGAILRQVLTNLLDNAIKYSYSGSHISLRVSRSGDGAVVVEVEDVAKATENSQQALYDKTIQDLTGRVQATLAQLKGAQLVAGQTPIELAAAQASETQSRARYDASLATLVEVADAEGLLAQAEMDDAVARLNVWRSLFRGGLRAGRFPTVFKCSAGTETLSRRRNEGRKKAFMWLIWAALRRPIATLVAVIVVALCSILAVVRMRIDIFPALNLPVIHVAQPYGGLDPRRWKALITNYYEYHFLYITGIDQVEEHVQSRRSRCIKLHFHPGTNMAQAMAETVGT